MLCSQLNLFDNNVGAEGAKALAPGLAANTSLTSLDLYKNNLGSEGAKALAPAIAASASLKKVRIACSRLLS